MNNTEEKSIILVIGDQEHNGEELIKLIIGTDNISNVETNENISFYPWTIDTKYYSADIRLCSINLKKTSVEPIASYVEGIIIYEDQVTENSLIMPSEWSHIIEICHPAIRLYVCRKSNPSYRDKAEQWYIKNQFEFVEIETSTDVRNSALEIAENVGIDRVIEVLQAHQWPMMTLKEQGSCISLMNLDPISSTNECQTEKNESQTKHSSTDANMDESETDDLEKLSILFQNLQSIKDRISSLSRDEKLKEAEMAVKTFWCAINGDGNEISDDEDDCAKNFME